MCRLRGRPRVATGLGKIRLTKYQITCRSKISWLYVAWVGRRYAGHGYANFAVRSAVKMLRNSSRLANPEVSIFASL
jgi:hypothetical protein